jgi:hypothetical protein
MAVGYACPPITDLTFVKGSPFVLCGPRREDFVGTIVIVEFWVRTSVLVVQGEYEIVCKAAITPQHVLQATWCPPCLES